MKVKVITILILLLIIGVIVWAKNSPREKFSQAKDFPNGALVYLQSADLSEVIKLWQESKLKEKYLQSQNFQEFQTSHLGIKLAERRKDLNEAMGFQFDLQVLSSLVEEQAAVAIYDIGKLDIVFIAPMKETVFLATIFAQNSQNFAENKLEDGTAFYLLEAEVDRQRQKQKVIFSYFKGRFVLATSENLFLRTIAAIKGKQRLYDEIEFTKLSERITPNLATIWVNQEKLNSDYYFKRYWLMSDVENLQNIRAGIFDLKLDDKGLTEKREFLLKEAQNPEQISSQEAQNLLSQVPAHISFFRLQKIDEKQLGEVIYNTFFDKQIVGKPNRNYSRNWSYIDDKYYENDFYYLNSDFEKEINEKDEEEVFETKSFSNSQISDAVNSAQPSAILTASSPKTLENPLFIEFRKIAIISLLNPKLFRPIDFENSIVEALKNRLTVADAEFFWMTENGLRKLQTPMLGWEISYQMIDGKLFITNSFELLQECLSTKNKTEIEAKDFSDLTVIRLENRKEIFDEVMAKLTENNSDFFTGNVAGLLDVMSDVQKNEISRKAKDGFLSEEILVK